MRGARGYRRSWATWLAAYNKPVVGRWRWAETGDDEVVSALKATLSPGVEVRKVASSRESDTRRRLDVCAVVKDSSTEVAQFVGIVDVVPKVQVPLSAREKAVKKARVEFTDIRVPYKIVGDQLYKMTEYPTRRERGGGIATACMRATCRHGTTRGM